MRSSLCPRGFFFVVTVILSALTLPVAGQIIKQPQPQSNLDRLTFAKRELRVSLTLTDADAIEGLITNREDMARFRSQYGAAWHFLIDKRTGRLNRLEGGAIPFIPGPANNLESVIAGCRTADCLSTEKIVSLARDFLIKNQGAIQVNPDELIPDPAGITPIGDSLYFVRFQWVRGQLPVEGGSVFLAVNNGNLIEVGVQNIGTVKLDPKPTISLERAWDILKTYVGGIRANDQIVNTGSLSIIPITPKELDPDKTSVPFGGMIDYVLVYKLAFRRPGIIGTWEGLVDAHTGELLRFRDSNDYGHIQGGVFKTDKPQVEVNIPLPHADYGGGCADTSGNFPGIIGTSKLDGPCPVKISDDCGAISLSSGALGVIDFGGSGGTDCNTPGKGGAGNTHSARTQHWNVMQIKMKAITYLPKNPWLQQQLEDHVNISSLCNAYWDGIRVNFFKSGGGCANTGELPGVSLHEWGHGMDSNDGSGFGADNKPIESRADWTAILQTHHSCTGSGFWAHNCSGYGDACKGCSGIRDADWAQHASKTAWTPQNNGTVYHCASFGYTGPCGWEDHCESGVATQALWDFVNRDLVGPPTNLDLATAWQLEDRLFYTGMPQSTNMYTCVGTPPTSNGCGAGSLYAVMRVIDDDGDGVSNGTPHAAAIFAALNRHGIACGAATDAANQNQTSCPSLLTPSLTVNATVTGNQVKLTWTTGGPNAVRYFIFRNETDCSAGFTKIATVNAPTLTYTDTLVVPGLTYFYRVQAATANDSCVSAMSECDIAVVDLNISSDATCVDLCVALGRARAACISKCEQAGEVDCWGDFQDCMSETDNHGRFLHLKLFCLKRYRECQASIGHH